MSSDQVVGGARGRARRAMHAELTAVAMELFLEHGFEETTVEDICTAAEISRSTFFRYFPSKEDALFGQTADAGDTLAEALAARPSDEQLWTAMRRAFDPLIAQLEAAGASARRLARLIGGQPALVARHREKHARWQESLRPEVARRLGTDPGDRSDPRADAVIATALGCFEAAQTAWAFSDQPPPLSALLDSAMGVIG
ncbi:TetR family transcriptional regulator [Amycolatopsis pigmentata]|uniref:TetR family transcriptional regulator n=1 Tax=Amycolatopsis pigmentata TaxID=450801 RepID=A0ABW5FJV8_9PSEU